MMGVHFGVLTSRRQSPSEEVADRLRRSLVEERFHPHDRLPSLRMLSREHGVAVNTVRKALEILEKEGLLYRRKGNGTFVHPGFRRAVGSKGGSGIKCVTIVHDLRAYLPHERERDARLLVGCTEAAELHNVFLRFAIWSDEKREYDAILSERFAFHEQGCVLFDVLSAELMSWLWERKVPFVFLSGSPYDRSGLPAHNSVIINKAGAGFEATRYLIELGHRRIGYVGSIAYRGVRNPLLQGRDAALTRYGLHDYPEDVLHVVTETPGEMGEGVRKFLNRVDRPSAILAGNDATAITVQIEARRMGLELPRDLSIIGYNNDPYAAEATPPLTTLDPPREALARTAIEMLMDISTEEKRNEQHRILECRLIVRESAAVWPPPTHKAAPVH